jgi:predicted TIM-barrel fold metal-dependent hydrolase
MYRGGVIDCDVHHDWPRPEALFPYLSDAWREYVTGGGARRPGPLPVTAPPLYPSPTGAIRDDAFPPNGDAPGSSYELLKEQLLDPFKIERAVLSYGMGAFVGAIPNPYFAAEVARASNDWSVDQWLSRDDERLYGAVVVSTQLPELAAKEIRRIGPHPRMCEVLLCSNGIGKPFGHPIFDPIYEAAAELNLPIGIHGAGEAFGGMNISPNGSGIPSTYIEQHVLMTQGLITHLVSFIVHGSFEKYPNLKVLLIEPGVAWIPALLWKFDMEYRGLQREAPWMRRTPSEYFHDHVRVTTQPLELSPKREQLVELLKAIDAQDILCFASDYPHWDTDEVGYIASKLPAAWHAKVFRENALELYGWQDDVPGKLRQEPELAADGVGAPQS